MCAGFSLLEVLLVLVGGSLFLFSVYQLFFYQQGQYRQQQGVLVTQENMRLGLHILKKRLFAAGEAGCVSVSNLSFYNHVNHLAVDLKITQGHAIYGFYGHESGWDPALPLQLSGGVAAQTDVVWVEKASYERAHLARAMMHADDPVYITQKKLFEVDDVVLIADCTHADLFIINAIEEGEEGQTLHTGGLSRTYGADAQVMRWQVETYYLAPHSQDASQLALYQKILLPDTPAVELLLGLEDLSIEYGLLLNNTPTFLTASAVNDWAQVRGLLLYLQGAALPPAQLNVVLYNALR
jgi:hypothetical protein